MPGGGKFDRLLVLVNIAAGQLMAPSEVEPSENVVPEIKTPSFTGASLLAWPQVNGGLDMYTPPPGLARTHRAGQAGREALSLL